MIWGPLSTSPFPFLPTLSRLSKCLPASFHRRTLWPQTPALRRLLYLCNFSNPRRSRPQRRNNHALPIPPRRLRRINNGRHWGCTRRLLGPRRARTCTRVIHWGSIYRASSRTNCRRLHRHEPEPRLAMDSIYDIRPGNALLAYRTHSMAARATPPSSSNKKLAVSASRRNFGLFTLRLMSNGWISVISPSGTFSALLR